jgi:hypothetical protein
MMMPDREHDDASAYRSESDDLSPKQLLLGSIIAVIAASVVFVLLPLLWR